MAKLFFFIGLPRSGKSLMAKRWLENKITFLDNNCYTEKNRCCGGTCEKDLVPRVVVCADDIRLALGHRWNGFVEPYVNATKLVMIRTLLQKHDVLVDGTHTTTKSIGELLNIDKDAIPYIIPTLPTECKRRAKETNQEDLYPVIDRMHHQLLSLSNSTLDNQYYSYDFIVRINDRINDMRSKVIKNEIRG